MTKNNMQKLIIFQNHQQNFLIGAPKFFLARAPKFLNPALHLTGTNRDGFIEDYLRSFSFKTKIQLVASKKTNP